MGTRLRSVVSDVPKPMAPVAGKPFLQHLLDDLYNQRIKHIVLSIGYKGETIQGYFGSSYRNMKISYSVEDSPLGTGGAVKKALPLFQGTPFYLFNGDTLFKADLWQMEKDFKEKNAAAVIAIKKMRNFDRYGTVVSDSSGKIISFEEKKPTSEGWINGGVYLLHEKLFPSSLSGKFSLEKEILEPLVKQGDIYAVPSPGYFIDIGIPTDYEKAQSDFSYMNKDTLVKAIKTDGNWTLFLDRDGVINERIPGNYIKYPREFKFLNQADKAVAKLNPLFRKTLIVTNQQGVGKSLMGKDLLDKVHAFMLEGIQAEGGNLDAMYYCPELAKLNPKCRKPNIGMGLQALADFPEIDFSKSIMVGDSISDIRFGKRLGMKTVFLDTKEPEEIEASYLEDVDYRFADLSDFAEWLTEK